MAALGQAFDANVVEPSSPRNVISPGDYKAEIVKSEMKDVKNSSNQYLNLELAILEGPYKNQRVFDLLNLINSNATAAEIAAKTLSAICHATGQMQVSDSDELHFKPMMIKVAVQPAGPDKNGVMRDAQNKVKGYFAIGGTSGVKKAPAGSGTPAASEETPFWRRRTNDHG